MSIKNEITKYEEIKGKFSTSFNNINKEIINCGGESSKTLSETPNKIKNIMSQYSKVAMGDLGQTISTDWNSNNKEFTIPLNLDFEPKRLIILLNSSDYGPEFHANTYIDTPKNGDVIKLEISDNLGYVEWIKVVSVDKSKIKFSFLSYSSNYAYLYFLKYIAIG